MSTTGTHARNDLCLALLSPLSDLRVNLVPELGLDFTSVSREERKESLSSAIDDVDFMQRNGVDNFSSFLDLSFWALDKLCLWTKSRREVNSLLA